MRFSRVKAILLCLGACLVLRADTCLVGGPPVAVKDSKTVTPSPPSSLPTAPQAETARARTPDPAPQPVEPPRAAPAAPAQPPAAPATTEFTVILPGAKVTVSPPPADDPNRTWNSDDPSVKGENTGQGDSGQITGRGDSGEITGRGTSGEITGRGPQKP
jgi:hypothetical protein